MTVSIETWVENPVEAIKAMAVGNMGAARVACELYKYRSGEARGALALMYADDSNIRGPQLWIAYKYHCNEDLHTLCERLIKRDEILTTPPPNR